MQEMKLSLKWLNQQMELLCVYDDDLLKKR